MRFCFAYFDLVEITATVAYGLAREEHQGVYARLRGLCRKRPYDLGIHLVCKNSVAKRMDSRVKPTGDGGGLGERRIKFTGTRG
jgi:uncharacterized protein (DUF2237 family)